ncbi:MAG: hypothetical protein ACOH2H_15380 [Cypionkella sp.]
MQDELETFFPTPRKVVVGGMDIPILTLTFMDLGKFSRPLRPVIPLLQAGDYRAVAEDYPVELCAAMSVATGVDSATLGDLALDDFLELVTAVVEANLSFFLDRVVPKLRTIATLLNPAPPARQDPTPVGPTPSPDLSAPERPLETSPD